MGAVSHSVCYNTRGLMYLRVRDISSTLNGDCFHVHSRSVHNKIQGGKKGFREVVNSQHSYYAFKIVVQDSASLLGSPIVTMDSATTNTHKN